MGNYLVERAPSTHSTGFHVGLPESVWKNPLLQPGIKLLILGHWPTCMHDFKLMIL
jgi:hypothetical protein